MHPLKAKSPKQIRQTDINTLIEEVVMDADHWRKMPNDQLGYMTPDELIGTPAEPILRNLLEMFKHGMVT